MSVRARAPMHTHTLFLSLIFFDMCRQAFYIFMSYVHQEMINYFSNIMYDFALCPIPEKNNNKMISSLFN